MQWRTRGDIALALDRSFPIRHWHTEEAAAREASETGGVAPSVELVLLALGCELDRVQDPWQALSPTI